MKTSDTPINLKQIEQRCEAATEGPWTWINWHGNRGQGIPSGNLAGTDGEKVLIPARDLNFFKQADGQFIAHSRQDLPAMARWMREAAAVLEYFAGTDIDRVEATEANKLLDQLEDGEET